MPVANANLSNDAKRRLAQGAAVTKANAGTQTLVIAPGRIRLKRLLLYVSTTLASPAVSVEVGNAVAVATAPSAAAALAVDTDRYYANTDAFGGVLDAAAGTCISLDLGGDIVPPFTPVTFTNNASANAGVYIPVLEYEFVDDNPDQAV